MPLQSHHALANYVPVQLTAASLLDRLDMERLEMSNRLEVDQHRRAELGQFMTPASVAAFMASMLDISSCPRELRILDAGCGTGMLTAAVVAELSARPPHRRPDAINVVAWEIDSYFQPLLERTFGYCQQVSGHSGIDFTSDVQIGDFISQAAESVSGGLFRCVEGRSFDVAILNPPYRKLNRDSTERACLDRLGMGTSNLYSAFVWLALELLRDGGEIVAITPRSFMNGTYFRSFREALIQRLAFRQVHVYEARNVAFSAEGVLQENVVFHGVRGAVQGAVRITTSYGPSDDGLTERVVDPSEMVLPDDGNSVMRLVVDENGARVARGMLSLSHGISDLGIWVSTGRVVGFRAKDRLHDDLELGDAPMVLPRHCRRGFVKWPNGSRGVANGLSISGPSDELVLPSGWYVLVNRFSAKEDRRRVVASLFDPNRLDTDYVAFDNKLNVFHCRNEGLPENLAKGLAMFLNSSVVDSYFRQLSGHTQVNAGDLRALKFPDVDSLVRLGGSVGEFMPSTDEIDQVLISEVPEMSDSVQATLTAKRIDEALEILKSIGVPSGQENERSALTLLALLDLGPEDACSSSNNPLRGVTDLMDWIRENYGKTYAPNTRETFRRFTLHQFGYMGLVVHNPDNPDRPPNSPNYVYQLHSSVLELVRSYGSDSWEDKLENFLKDMEVRNRLREPERDMATIPVTLPDGTELALTAGGQNDLVKEVIEEFASRFVPGGHVIYVGDAGASGRLFDAEYLAGLGVVLDEPGPMPDVVIHHIEKDWLVVVEAVTSHGPVNLLRLGQLRDLFKDCRCGLVYVTAFLDRVTMRRYLSEIAWETEVWVADAPTHLIHFDGEKFLGPYGEPAL